MRVRSFLICISNLPEVIQRVAWGKYCVIWRGEQGSHAFMRDSADPVMGKTERDLSEVINKILR